MDVSLVDGSHLEGCSLVSAGRLWARSLWLVDGETDLFISLDDIVDVTPAVEQEAA